MEQSLALPPYALALLEALEQAGYESWVVGGYIRDALLERNPSDADIATAATWREVQQVSEQCGWRTHETGTAHGTLTVVVDDHAIEVTTYRSDGSYRDARHPDKVSFVQSIEEDLARRDFTINALAYHPQRGLFDPFGGYDDLKAGIIRAVGNPKQRFSEDALRIVRACRFASQLGFSIEGSTYQGMLASKGKLGRISSERIAHELNELLLGTYAGQTIMETVDALSAVLPELVAMKGFDQNTPYHIYDVLEHTCHVVDGVPANSTLRWAALMHDMGKPAVYFTDEAGVGHFYDHGFVSVQLAKGIMGRFNMSTEFIARVLLLIQWHDEVIPAQPKAVKKVLNLFAGDTDAFEMLCDLKRADAAAQAPRCHDRVELAEDLKKVLAEILEQDEAFSLKQLAIDGNDVVEMGIERGPRVGQALAAALNAVIEEEIPNEREALRAFIGRGNW